MEPVEIRINVTEINEEVFFTRDAITKVSTRDIEFLKAKASVNRRKRVRLCAHRSIKDPVHEMLIIHTKDTYVRPHKHLKKSESFHIIEGKLKIVIFDESGGILEVINMGDYPSGDTFFYRLSESYFHTVILISDFVVFHETINGPFNREDNVFARWSPEENDHSAVKEYMDRLYDDLIRLKEGAR